MSVETALSKPVWLFCPATRSDRFEKAASAADVVILDLEDGVAPKDRPVARKALIDSPLDPSRTVVRINAHGTEDYAADLAALRRTGYTCVMLPKVESGAQTAELAPMSVVGICETPLGILNAIEIARSACVVGLMWGSEDLAASLGGRSSRNDDNGLHDVSRYARSQVLVAARASGKLAIDSVFANIEDLESLRLESVEAVRFGYTAKACIHPNQVAVIREAYRPSREELAWATRVLVAAADQAGAFQFEGSMVDEPVLQRARAILARHGA